MSEHEPTYALPSEPWQIEQEVVVQQPYHAGAAALDNALAAIADLQAECARLAGERALANGEAVELRLRLDRALMWSWRYRRQIEEERRERDAARAALAKFGRHERDCNVPPYTTPGLWPCTCGLTAALDADPQPREGTLTSLETER